MTQPGDGLVVLARPSGTSGRVFPTIDADLYQSGTPDNLSAEQQAALTFLHQTRHHRKAFEAELAGYWRRADFYWREFIASLSRLPTDPAHLHDRYVDEIGIDTQCAFYNGLAVAGDAGSLRRAAIHLNYLVKLATLSCSPEASLRQVVEPGLQRRIEQRKSAQEWRGALEDCRLLLATFPKHEPYADQLAATYVWEALAHLGNDKKRTTYKRDAHATQRGIQRVEEVRQKYPFRAAVFADLGFLHHVRAIRLEGAENLSDALEAVERAVTFDPSLRDALATRTRLLQKMAQLKNGVVIMEDDVRKKGNVRLNARGLQLQAEARKGLGPMQRYAASDQARQTAAARATALELRAIEAAQPAAQAASPTRTDLFVLPAAPPRRWRGIEPLVDWLFSRQDWLTKAQAGLATVLVLGIAGFSMQDAQHLQARDAAYQDIVSATARRDDLAVMQFAETFLSNAPLTGRDGRVDVVTNAYSESLARWFVEHDGRPEQVATDHVARYRALVIDSQSRGN